MYGEKFIEPFIQLVNENFPSSKHYFIIIKNKKFHIKPRSNIVFLKSNMSAFQKCLIYMKHLNQVDKIILHGLFDRDILLVLFFQPWLLKKCYWVMWGGDFYFPQKRSWIKKQIIKRIGHFVTYIKGDYELARKWYGAKGERHECFMYPSNLYKKYDIKPNEHNTINIQLGNSADPTNNHIEVLEKLLKYKDEDIKIFVPLSYGNEEYSKSVTLKGKEFFGDKFIPLMEFVPFEKYLEFLGEIDIAIFAHRRQQAMGNMITLLGLGKKVYMRSDITPWKLFKDIDIEVFDVENIELDLIDEVIKQNNLKRIKVYFSKENYHKQLTRLFEA